MPTSPRPPTKRPRPTARRDAGPRATGAARKSIVWLASYPKSGNTWLRMFIGNYLWNGDAPMPINKVEQIGTADASPALYRAVAGPAFNPAHPTQALSLRGRALEQLAANGADVNFVKTHNLAGRVGSTELVPAPLTRAAICILRDPRDVALSYARHFGIPLAKAVATMGERGNSTAGSAKTVKQFLGSWSDHVKSWTETRAFPVLTLRYEDMQTDPRECFAKVLRHIGLPAEDTRLDRAIRFSAFDELQRQETDVDFTERSSKNAMFFHTGTSGQWRDGGLAPDLVARIEADHGPMMRKWGYLNG